MTDVRVLKLIEQVQVVESLHTQLMSLLIVAERAETRVMNLLSHVLLEKLRHFGIRQRVTFL